MGVKGFRLLFWVIFNVMKWDLWLFSGCYIRFRFGWVILILFLINCDMKFLNEEDMVFKVVSICNIDILRFILSLSNF